MVKCHLHTGEKTSRMVLKSNSVRTEQKLKIVGDQVLILIVPGVEPFICEEKSTALKYFLGCRTP